MATGSSSVETPKDPVRTPESAPLIHSVEVPHVRILSPRRKTVHGSDRGG
jgi:hypothetical protein